MSSSVSFSCTVKSILFGINAISLELWNESSINTNNDTLGWSKNIAYIDGSSNTFNTNGAESIFNESLYSYTFPNGEQPLTLLENDTTHTHASSNVIYIPGNNIVTGNFLVFVCQAVTANITGAYIEHPNLLIKNFNTSYATVTSSNANQIISGGSSTSYSSTPFLSSGLSGNSIIVGDTSSGSGTSSAYIAFAFPLTTGNYNDVNVDLILQESVP